MTAKEYLRQAYIIDRKIRLDTEKLAAARSALYGKGVRYDGDGSKPARKNGGFESAVLRVLEIESRLDREIDELTAKRLEIEQAVNAIPDEVQREVLTRRYLLYQKFGDIAREMGYTERRIFQMHGEALKKISVNFS